MKKMFLLLSFIVFTVFISCQTESEPEPEPEIVTGVDLITIVNKSDTKLTIESLETFEVSDDDYVSGGRWYSATKIGKCIDEITVNYVLSPGQSKTIEFPYEYNKNGFPIKRTDLVKLNCTYGDNMSPFAWMNDSWSDDFDPDAADNPLLSERYLCPHKEGSGSVSLEFKSYTDSKFKTVYCLVTNKQ